MPVVGFLDLETTGLDFEKDQITEIGFVRKEWGAKKPHATAHCYLYDGDLDIYREIPEIITDLTGITAPLLETNGQHPSQAFLSLRRAMEKCDYIMAHNGEGFDKPMLNAKFDQYGIDRSDKHWLDSQHDIEWPFRSRRLVHLCVEAGFLNPFPHDALSDVMSMIRVAEWAEGRYFTDFDSLVEFSKQPWVYIKAHVDYNSRQLAKDARFRWESIDDKTFPKTWVKKIKESHLGKEKEEIGEKFKITTIGN